MLPGVIALICIVVLLSVVIIIVGSIALTLAVGGDSSTKPATIPVTTRPTNPVTTRPTNPVTTRPTNPVTNPQTNPATNPVTVLPVSHPPGTPGPIPPDSVVIFSNNQNYNGYLGSTRQTPGQSGLSTKDICDQTAASLGLGCSATGAWALLSWDDTAVSTIRGNFNSIPASFAVPTNRPVYSADGIMIAPNWADFMQGASASLDDARVFTYTQTSFWTGTNSNNTASTSNCVQWQSGASIETSLTGRSNQVLTPNWKNTGSSGCNTPKPFLCGCYKPIPNPPTPAPTAGPTSAPTTATTPPLPTNPPTLPPPTIPPAPIPPNSVAIYSNNVLYDGNLGVTRASNGSTGQSTQTICNNAAIANGITCSGTAWALMSWDDTTNPIGSNFLEMPTAFGFPDTQPVYSKNGTQIASNWTNFLLPHAVSLDAAGVFDATSVPFWTGTGSTNTTSAFTCTTWTVSSGTSAQAGSSQITNNSNWKSSLNRNCSSTARFACACFVPP